MIEPTEADKAAAEAIAQLAKEYFDSRRIVGPLLVSYSSEIISQHMATERAEAAKVSGEIEQLKFHNAAMLDMNADDWQKLVEWLKNPDRKPSMFAFTAGLARQAAAAVEQSKVLAELEEARRNESFSEATVGRFIERYSEAIDGVNDAAVPRKAVLRLIRKAWTAAAISASKLAVRESKKMEELAARVPPAEMLDLIVIDPPREWLDEPPCK